MPTRQNFQAYHESIAGELRVAKDRMRNLIGDRHWQSDGEHKEAILRKLLRTHVAQSLQIGRGFVCGDGGASSQIDILITHRDKPTLFRDGELLLVTPDAVAAIIEVKTRIDNLAGVLHKLARSVAMIRDAGNNRCLAGLFVYEPLETQDAHNQILEGVHGASRGQADRVVNWVAAGPSLFVRHWAEGARVSSPVPGPVWHSYTLENLSHAYFVSNVVWDTCHNLDQNMQYAWFPVEGTKERYLQAHVGLGETLPLHIDGCPDTPTVSG